MKKPFLSILFIVINSIIYAQIPANYYDSANGLTGYALKTELSNIITSGHDVSLTYDDLYTGYITTDTDNYYEHDGSVLDMYSEIPDGPDHNNYTHGNNKCGNYSHEGDCYNREHLMPQSWFNSASPMKSDIHHVVPADGKVNGYRSSFPLADVGTLSSPPSTITNPTSNGSKLGTCSDTGYSGTVFEPIDEFKGDIARIYFYMATRYEDEIGSWGGTTTSGEVLDGSSDQVFEDWYLAVLLQWSAQDGVSQREIDRNNAAYDYQGNRNPFIDHPEYIQMIWNQNPDTENPTTPTNLVASNISYNSVDLSWTASSDNTGVTSYKIYQDGVLIGSTPTANFTVTGLTGNTTYDFYVIAYDASNNHSSNSTIESVTTLITPTFLISEDFNDCATVPNSFVTYSEQSNKNWTCFTTYGYQNTGCMQMNGYNDDMLSKDWLITKNKLDFDLYDNEKLSVYLIYTFGDMSLDLLYSTDYDGTSDPSQYNWTAMPNVTIDTSIGSDTEIVQEIINADISTLNQPAYVAFKYYGTTEPTRWTVDNFNITGNAITSDIQDSFMNTVSIYPNPTNDTITIKSNTKINNVTIYNVIGKLVLKTSSTQININHLNNGIHICKIQDELGNIVIKKIVKN